MLGPNSERPERSNGAAEPAHLTRPEFAAAFRDVYGVLWTIAAGVLGAGDEADDVLQEASLMGLEKLHLYRRGTNFTAWMGSFVRNVARNDLRKRHRRRVSVDSPEEVGAYCVDPRGEVPDRILAGAGSGGVPPVNGRGELRADAEAFDDRILTALRNLGGTQRACLLLRAVQDLSYREISQALDIPEGTAMSHVHRARLALREELVETPTPIEKEIQ